MYSWILSLNLYITSIFIFNRIKLFLKISKIFMPLTSKYNKNFLILINKLINVNYIIIIILISKSILKIITTLNLIFLPILCFFFTDIIILWFIIEISNFLFIYSIINKIKKNIVFFYFIIQLLASFIIIFSVIQFNFIATKRFLSTIIIIALFIKLGIPPFHTWIIIIANYLTLNLLFFIITIQKIISFYILTQIKLRPPLLYISIFFCAIIPPFIIFNLTNLKSLLTYSSINQTGWILILIYIKDFIWIKYFYFYTIVLICIIILIEYQKILFTSSHKKSKEKDNWLILFSIFNLGGLPPFAFFYFKWSSISIFLINAPFHLFAIILLLRSLIILYIYSIMIIKSSITYKFNSKTFKKKNSNSPSLIIIFLITLTITLIFLIWK